jgi:ribose 5-phosphate isomerase B
VRIAFGTDEDTPLTDALMSVLAAGGHEVEYLAPGAQWPEVGRSVGEAVAQGRAERGLMCCYTGTGVTIAANKVPGVRAAVVHDVTTASLARQHNHANVVCFGGRTTGESTALDALDAFLAATPQHGRHDRRVEEVAELEQAASAPPPSPDPVTAGGSR